jgi:type IV fimbrial biogenesis protein FimT
MVLVLLAIVGSMASASMGKIGHAIGLRVHTEDFLLSLRAARSEALKRNVRVTMCKSGSGATCATVGGWEQGWILFEDTDNDGVADPHEIVIRRVHALPAGWSLTGNESVESYVSYSPLGRTRMTSGAFQAGTVTLCGPGGEALPARQIVINSSGRARATAVQAGCT